MTPGHMDVFSVWACCATFLKYVGRLAELKRMERETE